MIRPDNKGDRINYGEAIAPYEGYKLTKAIGCTYSMDLEMLLTIPIALNSMGELGDTSRRNALQMLDGLIKSMGKIQIYCQKGKINVPKENIRLFSLLEESIYEVPVSKTMSFHPKVWIIRFENKKDKKDVRYKILVLSRNMTYDRSYDISILLEGKVGKIEIESNKELCEFLEYLNKKHRIDNYKKIYTEILKLEIVTDSNVKGIEFSPIIEGKTDINIFNSGCNELLIISPFLSEGKLKEIAKTTDQKPRIISRKNEMNKISEEVMNLFHAYNLKDEIIDGERILDTDGCEVKQQDIHAKIYIRDIRQTTELYLGSANCSRRAFANNTEFMVKIDFNKRKYKTDDFVKEILGLGNNKELLEESIFEEYKRGKIIENTEIEDEIEKYIFMMENLNFDGEIEVNNRNYSIYLKFNSDLEYCSKIDELIKIGAIMRPLTLKNKWEKLERYIKYDGIELKNISRFFVIRIEIEGIMKESLITIGLDGIPEERNNEIVKEIISNKQTFLNYISFILGDGTPIDIQTLLENEKELEKRKDGNNIEVFKRELFEKLLKAVSREKEKIEWVVRLTELIDNKEILSDDLRELINTFKNYK